MANLYSIDRGSKNVSINASNANGAGDAFSVPAFVHGELPFTYGWQVAVSGGAYSALSVNLEGSLDGVTWATLDSSTATGGEIRLVSGKKVLYIRINKVSSTTSSGTPVVTGIIVV